MATATQERTQLKTTYPSSFRFRPRIHEKLSYYSKSLRRKKSSLVEEALEKLFDEEEKKAVELKKLQELIQAGRDSGSTGGIPTLEEIKTLAKERSKVL